MPGKPRASRRDDILATFVRHVAERGYEQVSMADMASELGMAQGTIVYHFGSKAQLLRELEENYMRRRIADLKLIWDQLSAPDERVAALIYATVLMQVVDRYATIATQREIVQLADDPEMQEIRQMRDELAGMLTEELRRGVESGVFRPVDVGVVTVQIFGSAQWMWTWFDPAGRRTAEEVAATYIDVFLGGLLVDRFALSRLTDPAGPMPAVVRAAVAPTHKVAAS
ncbi:TetR/AcrR family transcriptional regulator [Pseudonocardia sp. Cha107L01]|jgi:AcrR family transcriptional regulator|uniref:TetR/AcrR family transcriptional regulator n=1 Tax=Pseudonocardia sp. Cha107L01 TaxID=3457576 RepID=UPI00403E6D2D